MKKFREYITELNENPLVTDLFVKKVLPVCLIGAGLMTSFNYFANSDYVRNSQAKAQERREFVNDITSKLNENTIYAPISDNVVSVDVEGDGNIDAYLGFVGARPGAIHLSKPRE